MVEAPQQSADVAEHRRKVKEKRVEKKLLAQSFADLNLSPEMLSALEAAKFSKPTPIQAGLIPLALEQYDVLGQARTGTGKTASFAIPILEQLDYASRKRDPQALILVPTRELAVQVLDAIRLLSGDRKIKSAAIYGGKPIKQQINHLADGCQVVVGTPGRVIDHIERRTICLDSLWCVVLDEADRMLDVGFRPAIEKILRRCPRERQTLMLSATVPYAISELAKRYMDHPKLLNMSEQTIAVKTIEQRYFSVFPDQKFALLLKLLKRDKPRQAIVFCRTKLGTESLFRRLSRNPEFIEAFGEGVTGTIHGDMGQSARDRTMEQFRSEEMRFLIATDVVGRGIDVSHISHIINFDVPELCDDYVHRVGRTGRMGRDGVAYSLVSPVENSLLRQIEKRINSELEMDFFEGFDMPNNAKASPAGRKYRRAL